jgi:hypothetical protein
VAAQLAASQEGLSSVSKYIGPKRDEATGEWRKLGNYEMHNLYLSIYY